VIIPVYTLSSLMDEVLRRLMEGDSDGSWEPGSVRSSGIAGAPGPLMNAMGWTDPRQIVVCTTPDDGLNTFQGRLQGISLLSREEPEGGYILTVYFDSETATRLRESLSGKVGRYGTVDAESFPMTVTVAPLSM